MAIGSRIKFFRTKNDMTQKQLGERLGFREKTADVRMAQYEAEARIPKDDLVKQMAHIFDISTHALTVPDIDTDIGFMHTLFALEDMYNIRIDETDEGICLRLNDKPDTDPRNMRSSLREWKDEANKLAQGEVTQKEYDRWRYTYPAVNAERARASMDALREKRTVPTKKEDR